MKDIVVIHLMTSFPVHFPTQYNTRPEEFAQYSSTPFWSSRSYFFLNFIQIQETTVIFKQLNKMKDKIQRGTLLTHDLFLHHRNDDRHGDNHAQDENSDPPDQVLLDLAHGGPSDFNGSNHITDIVLDEDNIPGFFGNICTGTNGNSHIL